MTLLDVSGLTVGLERSPASILTEVGFRVEPGQIVGLVGESGSGKTMAALTVMGLLPQGLEMRNGSIRLGGDELVHRETRTVALRAGTMAMIFQHPRAALNPTMRIGRQIAPRVQAAPGQFRPRSAGASR